MQIDVDKEKLPTLIKNANIFRVWVWCLFKAKGKKSFKLNKKEISEELSMTYTTFLRSLSKLEEMCIIQTKTNENNETVIFVADKGQKPQKLIYATKVSLYEKEFTGLVRKYGEVAAKEFVRILNDYKVRSGREYKSDYNAINNWVIKRYMEQQAQPTATPTQKIKIAGIPIDAKELQRLRDLQQKG